MLYTCQIVKDEPDLLLAYNLRKEVFVKEQAVNENIERDSNDLISIHFLVKKENFPVATARVRETEKGMKIERFAVLKSYRSEGIGRFLGIEILKYLRDEKPVQPIYLNAQVQVISFYEGLGFQVVGETFKEAGIWHKKMIKV